MKPYTALLREVETLREEAQHPAVIEEVKGAYQDLVTALDPLLGPELGDEPSGIDDIRRALRALAGAIYED